MRPVISSQHLKIRILVLLELVLTQQLDSPLCMLDHALIILPHNFQHRLYHVANTKVNQCLILICIPPSQLICFQSVIELAYWGYTKKSGYLVCSK
jgi:hypothetical protein